MWTAEETAEGGRGESTFSSGRSVGRGGDWGCGVPREEPGREEVE